MKWSQFERYLREWAIKNGYQSRVNMKQMMYHANGTNKINKDIFEKYIILNEMRTNLVHGYYFKYQSIPQIEKEQILNQLEEFINTFAHET
jgi:hypothetical protein